MNHIWRVGACMGVALGLAAARAESAAADRERPAALSFTRDLFASPSAVPRLAWVLAAGFEAGDVGGEPSAWRAPASLPEGKGMVWIDLDRAALNEDLALTLLHRESAGADLAVQLWDAQGRVVALDLFRNSLALADAARTDTFILPLRGYPSATRIVLRRISGAIELHGALLMPVVTEQPAELDLLLETARRLGDPLSPEGDLMRRMQEARRRVAASAVPPAAARTPAPNILAPAQAADPLPPPRPLRYAGFDWLPLRTDFELREDAIAPVPRPRAGRFDYNHCGHGRGPAIVTRVGDRSLRDCRIELDACSTGVNPALNPHGLNPQYAGFSVMFRVVEHAESWNDKSWSGAYFYVANEGTNRWWDCAATRNYYCDTPRGHFNERQAGGIQLAKGTGLVLDREKGNHVRLDVRGDRVQVWFDGEPVCDVTEPQLHEAFEGITLDHGGVGVMWGFDTMGWARNIQIHPL